MTICAKLFENRPSSLICKIFTAVSIYSLEKNRPHPLVSSFLTDQILTDVRMSESFQLRYIIPI